MREVRSQKSDISRTAGRRDRLLCRPLLTSDLCLLSSGKRSRSAFTLVELLTVVAIIAVLAGLILGISGYATLKADRSRAITDMNKLQNAMEEFRLARSSYPSNYPSWDSITAVSNADFFSSLTNSLPKDFDQSELQLSDPWGNTYWYQSRISAPGKPAFQYRLWSTGPDSLDAGDDITIETGGQ